MATPSKKVDALRLLLDRLEGDIYSIGPRREGFTALERLLALVIQGSGKLAVAERGINALQSKFGNWSEVRVARAFEVQDVLKAARIPEPHERGLFVQEYLRRVFGLQNHLELDWLYDATSERRDVLLDQLTMAPPHAAAILDLDAIEEGESFPVCKNLKLLFSRLGLVKNNPKEVDVRTILGPLTEGKLFFPNFVKLRLLAYVGCDPKNPQGRNAHLLQLLWKEKKSKSLVAFAEAAQELKLPLGGKLGTALKPASKKKVAKKKAAPKKTSKK